MDAAAILMTNVGLTPAHLLVPSHWPTDMTHEPQSLLIHGMEWPVQYNDSSRHPPANVVTIRTAEGYQLRCDPRSQVMAIRSDRLRYYATEMDTAQEQPQLCEALSLQPNDRVILNMSPSRFLGWPGSVHLLGTEESVEKCLAVGYALGHLIGDGVIDGQTARWRVYTTGERQDPSVLEPVKAWLERAVIDSRPTERQRWLDFDSGYISVQDSVFLNQYGRVLGVRHGNKHFTELMMQCNSTLQRGLVAGIFDTDGSASLASNHVTISQEHYDTLAILQQMLHAMGIVTAISQTHRGDSTRRPCYDLRVRPEHVGRFLRLVPVQNQRKLSILQQIYADRLDPSNSKVADPTRWHDIVLHRATVESVLESDRACDLVYIQTRSLGLVSANAFIMDASGQRRGQLPPTQSASSASSSSSTMVI